MRMPRSLAAQVAVAVLFWGVMFALCAGFVWALANMARILYS